MECFVLVVAMPSASLFLFGQCLVDLHDLILDIVAVVGIIKVCKQVCQYHETEPTDQYVVFFYQVKHLVAGLRYGLVSEACFQLLSQVVDVHVYPDEHYLLHAVAIGGIPVVLQPLVAGQDGLQFLLGHGGIPLARLVQRYLSACLLKEIAHVLLALEIAHALGADDAFGPLASNEVVEITKVERTTAIEYPGADTVLVAMWVFCIVMMSAAAVSVLVVVVVMSAMRAYLLILILMMMMLVAIMVVMLVLALMAVLVFIVVMMMLLLVMSLFVMRLVKFLYPFGRGGNSFKVEHAGI